MKVYVLHWTKSDGSSFGIIGVYSSEELAEAALKLLENHGDPHKEFMWEETTLIGS